jgi:uncharacterized protein YjeT (DUF2065 family)
VQDFLTALGLVLVIEGLLYAAAPDFMLRMVEELRRMPQGALRLVSLFVAALGLLIVWAVRR